MDRIWLVDSLSMTQDQLMNESIINFSFLLSPQIARQIAKCKIYIVHANINYKPKETKGTKMAA